VEPLPVVVTDAAGRDLLLIPLVRRTHEGLRTIEFADQWATDYNAPLIGPDAPTDVDGAEALWRAVYNALPPADRICFTKMPVDVRGVQNPLALLRNCGPSDMRGHIVELPDRYEDYVRSLKKDVQSLLRRRWERLVKDTGAKLRWIEDPDEGRRVLSILHEQQTARLDSLGTRHVFDNANYRKFYERHVSVGLRTGRAVLTAIVAGEEVLATFLGVTDDSSCTLIRSSQVWSEGFVRYGLGKLIISHSMRALHERGYRLFDLSVGDSAYKHDFGVKPVAMMDLDLVCSWRALPSAYRDYGWKRLKQNRHALHLARSVRPALNWLRGSRKMVAG
jgi:CelD/BcsL family acetyltransferase involved in cellulose biosynthesis